MGNILADCLEKSRFLGNMNGIRCRIIVVLVGLVALGSVAGLTASERVHALKITVLSTMLADGAELGEWGFAALVEADGHRILFDTGAHADVALKNAGTLGIELGNVPDVVLSHVHSDHVGGFLALRQPVLGKSPP